MLNMRKFTPADIQRHIYTYAPPKFPEECIRVTGDFFPTHNIGTSIALLLHKKNLTSNVLGMPACDGKAHIRWEPQEEGVMRTAASFPSERNQGYRTSRSQEAR
jgi:hypothetical protein